MAKGDQERGMNQLRVDRSNSQNRAAELKAGLEPQYNQFWNNYNQAVTRQTGDYQNLMGRYNEFADTGGFSPQDISNIRARSVSPLRASYAAAQRDVNRLGGGMSAGGRAVLGARMAREQGQSMSDATRAAEGDIAEMRQKGRLAGIGGLLSGYAATPGQAALYGNQSIAGMGQRLAFDEAQNRNALGLSELQQRYASQPGKWRQGFTNTLDVLRTGGQLLYPWMFPGGGGGNLPSTPVGNQNPWGGQGGLPGFAPTVPSYGPGGGNLPGTSPWGGNLPPYPLSPPMSPPEIPE